jgi:hypothetical protein
MIVVSAGAAAYGKLTVEDYARWGAEVLNGSSF